MQLPVRERHAGAGARSRKTDQMLRADVRRENGGADQEPAGIAAREEVVGGVLLLLQRAPDADGGVRDEVQGDDRPVESRKGNGGAGHESTPLKPVWIF